MDITNILGLLGGLALFLHGMQMMSSGLEAAAGNRMKGILEKLTANRLLGILVGAVITAVIQSSSATTVMVVGFVNSGMMTLRQAVWIIMGANIGTTITGQLIALDVGVLAPLFAFIGVAMMVFLKKPQSHHFGSIIGGLGVLFIGMDMMSASMAPLREMPGFVSLMTTFSNPVIGILAGALFTAVIQSSSASVGILQALANSGVIGLPSAVYVLFGQNIGTCITAVLASIGTTRNAKRTTIIHLMFNIIGTVIFTALFILFPIASVIDGSLVLPGALVGAVCAPLGGWFYDKFGAVKPILIPIGIAILGPVLMLVFSMQLTPLLLAGFYFIFGLFYSIGNANVMTSGLSEVSPEFKPDGNAIFNTCLQFGGAAGTALFSTILSVAQAGAGEEGTAEFAHATAVGGTWTFATMTVICLIGWCCLATAFRIRAARKHKSDHQ